MALTNPRPLPMHALESEILHNNASPVFQASSLVFSPKPDGLSHSEPMGVIPGTPNSDDNSSNDGGTMRSGTPKKESSPLELSKVIPVTGERPMPKDRASPLDDDVLYAVFVILWEKDSTLQGMTVKQLSDHLLEKHPDMNNLSTKLSNLISAKLNAYVKKLEKGEKTLVYALSREWSNSSPRRMVYVYRGILSPDYKKHAQAAAPVNVKRPDSTKNEDIESSKFETSLENGSENLDSSITVNNNNNNKRMHSSNAFTLNSEFNVPYLTSPVSVVLTPNATGIEKKETLTVPNDSQKRSHDEEDDIDEEQMVKRPNIGPQMIPHNSGRENNTYVTAAAAAPRISKLFTKNGFKTTTSNATGIMTAIHKVIYTQNPIESRRFSKVKNNQDNLLPATWLKTVRDGFLTNDIESPESISFEDLEGILNQA
ncbi:hypothetical protein ZYGR_0N01990 [Zygosaccharomyces rouxii]|uniref:ZYRO0D04906p n=2 Tax=Zygosaccharomyces rouxii TaxID=4956 RepID=C5DV94_ZYGRC|nr:uncharacterized protein ZYRO0D04906g [Zygosaccharomyces rouxii]KAH9200626.1 hypothetical protein LQ764DRAFT_97222 [Zygosaccharomyces rouxii]GAV48794.1 hypothetical protein ZYGR_0N01990 [Zygosaccharomyces rouxii]CAR27713.1 ZYRO0D04906p [Zygosaccharomyces rouxii]